MPFVDLGEVGAHRIGIRQLRFFRSGLHVGTFEHDEYISRFDDGIGPNPDLSHNPAAIGRHDVLHLHRFQDDERLAACDLVADRGSHADDERLHRRQHLEASSHVPLLAGSPRPRLALRSRHGTD